MTFNSKIWIMVLVVGLSALWLGSQTVLVLANPEANPTVTVLSPSGAATDVVGEGDDYFTQVLHEPRTMDRQTDLIWQSFGIDNISYSNGIWSGTTRETGGHSEIYALYPGSTSNPSLGESAAEIGKTGWNYPIQTSKYTQISFRIKAPDNAGAGSNRWWHVTYSNMSHTLEVAHYDGVYYPNVTGWQVYSANLASKTTWTSNPSMYGIGFRFGLTQGDYQFDWIRLVDPTTSPVYTIKFSVANAVAGDVVDLECYTTSQAGADSFCGSIATGIPVNAAGTYQYAWRTAYLPPANYYVRAVVRRGATTASGMSNGALTVAGAPVLDFTTTSMTSGPDYATVELGSPWDMSDSNSIFTKDDFYRKPHDFAPSDPQCPCFANGEMYGTVGRYDTDVDSSEFGDPFVYLHVNRNKPINAAKYKYLTFRYKVDRNPWWANSTDRLSEDTARQVYPAGWVMRGVFFSDWPLSVLQTSNTLNDVIIFDDWNTYQLDLSQGTARGYWEPGAPQSGSYWMGLKSAIRFDFLEGVDPWTVHLDYVKLTGDDVANGSYVVRWAQLTGSTPNTIDVYASTDRNACLKSTTPIYHWTGDNSGGQPADGPYKVFLPLIMGGSGGGSGSADSFTWNTAGVAAGTYYLCARVNDGLNTSTMVSQAAVVVSH
jgi:hypothetical protein